MGRATARCRRIRRRSVVETVVGAARRWDRRRGYWKTAGRLPQRGRQARLERADRIETKRIGPAPLAKRPFPPAKAEERDRRGESQTFRRPFGEPRGEGWEGAKGESCISGALIPRPPALRFSSQFMADAEERSHSAF